VTAMKMTANVTPIHGVLWRRQDGSRSRHCSESETLPHGFCSKGLLRIAKHDQIRGSIAKNFRKTGLTLVEGNICNATNGSIRRFDSLAIDVNKNIVWILHPTQRFERSGDNGEWSNEVNKEKQFLWYEPCITDLLTKYKLKSVKVTGLLEIGKSKGNN